MACHVALQRQTFAKKTKTKKTSLPFRVTNTPLVFSTHDPRTNPDYNVATDCRPAAAMRFRRQRGFAGDKIMPVSMSETRAIFGCFWLGVGVDGEGSTTAGCFCSTVELPRRSSTWPTHRGATAAVPRMATPTGGNST